MKIPQALQFDNAADAFECAAGMVAAFPFWHEPLMKAASAMRSRMLTLEASDGLTAKGSDALAYFNYLFTCKNESPEQFLSLALSGLFLKPKTNSDRMCRTLAEGIVHLAGFKMTFHK